MNGVRRMLRHTDMLAAVSVVLVVTMLVVPLPSELLSVLITLNIAGALTIVCATMYLGKALDFAAFPSLLLLTTMFRLAINVSVTRLILTTGEPGSVVKAFGEFVVGGNVVVGLVIFLILVVIQFVVVTNGAGRVAEVGARFTLDAMPGKQMAIDADLNAGLITDDQARARRMEIASEADFYGSMDGASKFVKGDAMAAVIIVAINLVGGIIVGMLQHGLSFGEATHQYSLLTVGDGLSAQIPALLISVATGIRRLLGHTDLLAAVAVVCVVTMLVVPLPSALLDLLITINISAGLAIVVASMYLQNALEFSAFPSLLLLTTMFRLAINVSVTRLILTTGDAGSAALSARRRLAS